MRCATKNIRYLQQKQCNSHTQINRITSSQVSLGFIRLPKYKFSLYFLMFYQGNIIRQHNTTKHGGTGQSPLERYMASNGRIRRPSSREWLDEAFHNRVIRSVNRDATVHLLNTCYDAPMQFIGQKVEVRFLPGDTQSAYILYGGQHYPLRLTDRVANGRTKRQTALFIDYAKEGRKDVY